MSSRDKLIRSLLKTVVFNNRHLPDLNEIINGYLGGVFPAELKVTINTFYSYNVKVTDQDNFLNKLFSHEHCWIDSFVIHLMRHFKNKGNWLSSLLQDDDLIVRQMFHEKCSPIFQEILDITESLRITIRNGYFGEIELLFFLLLLSNQKEIKGIGRVLSYEITFP